MICGLDYGDKYIGVALSDETLMLARGVTTLVRKDGDRWIQELKEILATNRVQKIVVGLPKTLSGEIGIAATRVQQFVKMLENEFRLPTETWDERLSTAQAERYLRETPVSGSKRREKVNQLAAQIILQSYLDFHLKKKS